MQTRSHARGYSVADDPQPDVWRLRARLELGEIDVYGAASRVAAVNIPSGHFRSKKESINLANLVRDEASKMARR